MHRGLTVQGALLIHGYLCIFRIVVSSCGNYGLFCVVDSDGDRLRQG